MARHTITEFARGYAGDITAAGGDSDGAWAAWAACETDESALFREISRAWPLRPDVAVEDWRRRPPAAFTLLLAGLSAGSGQTAPRELARSAWLIQGPVLAARPGQAPWVVWVERREADFAVLAWSDGHTFVVARGGWPILSPAAAADASGRLWVAWQEADGPEGGGGRVCVACLHDDGRLGDAQQVSAPGTSNWCPSLAATPDGRVWCAWDTWDGTAYRVLLRGTSVAAAAGEGPTREAWREPLALGAPAGGGYDLEPSLAADSDGRLWVAWSHSGAWGHLNHRFWHRRSIHVQVVAPDAVAPAIPAGYDERGALPLPVVLIDDPREEETIVPVKPRLVCDRHGVHLVYRRLHRAGYMGFGWDVWSVTHTGQGWSAPERLSGGAGFPDTPFGVAAAPDGALWLAYHACAYGDPVQGGDMPGDTPGQPPRYPTFSKHAVSEDRLVVERVRPTSAPAPPAAIRVRPVLPLPPASTDATQAVAAAGSGVDRQARAVGQEYQLLFGDLHRHSLYSKCLSANDGDVLDHVRWACDVGGLDFYALTEHLEYMSYGEWRRIEDLTTFLQEGAPVHFLHGFELAIAPGHANFLYLDPRIGEAVRVACLSSHHLAEVWPKLDAWIEPGSVLVVRHHQGHRQPGVTGAFAARHEPLIEIVQSRGEFREWVETFLRAGCRVGFVGATDHAYAPPFPRALTGVWATDTAREAIFDALWQRRTFATNGPQIRLFVTAAGVAMGGEGTVADAPEVRVDVAGTATVQRVELYRDGALLRVEEAGARCAVLTLTDENVAPGSHYYYVRVLQDREVTRGDRGLRPNYGVAYSSPVWLRVGEREAATTGAAGRA